MSATVSDAVAALVGRPVATVRARGGALHDVELADGTRLVAKSQDRPGATAAEAAGLAWLAEPGAVPVPAVHGHDAEWLVLDRVADGRATAAAAAEFGRRLAALHAAGAPAFGAPPPGGPADAWMGLAPMRDVPGALWPAWFAEHRIEPYLRTAVDAGAVDADERRVLDTVCARIDDLAGPPEPPARIHGDLWSGNVLWAPDGVWLIDPAAHGGHRETDLATLAVFGCPHLDRILAAYDEAAPLADGWRDRVPLHQLFILTVHVALFGRGYTGQTVAAARAALRG
jgi:fructosamine-3-kinase